MMTFLMMLAQATSQPAAPTGGAEQTQPDLFGKFLLPMVLVMGFMMLMSWRRQKRERQDHESMLNNLKRNDRVITISGMFGTVVEARDNDVVIKIDETNNVKVRVLRSAIKEVVVDKPSS